MKTFYRVYQKDKTVDLFSNMDDVVAFCHAIFDCGILTAFETGAIRKITMSDDTGIYRLVIDEDTGASRFELEGAP